jgi:hypothetical protein
VTLAATFLGGAQSRLLPASIPFRFFAAAAAFHVLMWHANRAENGRPLLLSEIAAGWPLKLHAVCHGLALIGVGTAIAIDRVALLRAASGIGLAGSIALAWFMADVLRCVFRSSV